MDSVIYRLREEKDRSSKEGLYGWLQATMAFHSCRIEGNKTSYGRVTRLFLERDNQEAEDSFDHTEVIEHFQLFDAMLDQVGKPLTTDMIREFHRIFRNDNEDYEFKNGCESGLFRTKPAKRGCPAEEIEGRLQSIISDFRASLEDKKPTLRDLAKFHVDFENIHPFPDDNGAIGRIILLKQCFEYEMAPAMPGSDTRSSYFLAFESEKAAEAMEEYLKKEQWMYGRIIEWWRD